MQSNTLTARTPRKRARQVGRGGTRGKTSGRGTKGQNSRAGHKKRPELRDIIKTLPKLRGRGKNSFKAFAIKPAVVNVEGLEKHFASGASVTPSELQKVGLINIRKGILPQVKILGTGELSKKLSVKDCFVSAEAKTKIEKAGGSVEVKN